MYCTNCGEQIDERAVACPYCGTKTHNARTQQGQTSYHPMAKSKIAAGLLGIFLGTWGVHNFYLKRNSQAVTQLLLGTLGMLIIIGPIISGIWGLIEGIFILAGEIKEDGEGIPLRD